MLDDEMVYQIFSPLIVTAGNMQRGGWIQRRKWIQRVGKVLPYSIQKVMRALSKGTFLYPDPGEAEIIS